MPAHQGQQIMVCDKHHEVAQQLAEINAEQRRQGDELRQQSRDLRELMMHLIPQQTRNGNGISISAGNTQHGPQQSAPGADWSRLWISILMLALVVVGGWLVSIGVAPAQQTTQAQPR